MEKLVTYDQVKDICSRLKAEGSKVSARSILAETGGSMTTVLQYKKRWEDEEQSAEAANIAISSGLQTAILAEIGRAVGAAKKDLSFALDAAGSRETEALEALGIAEKTIEEQSKELKTVKDQADTFRQDAEKSAALAAQNKESLEKRLEELEKENDQLIKAGEAARTETAKAQMQVERADKAAEVAEKRVDLLEKKLEENQTVNTVIEKKLAVSETRLMDLGERLKDFQKSNDALTKAVEKAKEEGKTDLQALKAESKERIQEFKKELEQVKGDLAEERKGRGAIEKELAGLIEKSNSGK